MGTARHNRAQAIETVRGERIGKAIEKGPEQLDGATRLALLSDPVALSRLHTRVWEEDRDDWLGRWRKAEADDPRRQRTAGPGVPGDAGLLPAARLIPCPGGTPPGHGLFLPVFPVRRCCYPAPAIQKVSYRSPAEVLSAAFCAAGHGLLPARDGDTTRASVRRLCF